MRPGARLAERIGLPLRRLDLLDQALVHASYLHEHPELAGSHNERLEHLGDAVVDLVISEALFLRHPNDDEGRLSVRRAVIVSTTGLAELGRRLGLDEFVLLGEGEARRDGRERPSILASTFEAVVGALHLELGFEPVRDWLVAFAAPELENGTDSGQLKSAKSRLQELLQERAHIRPIYRVAEITGPPHDRRYRVDAEVAGELLGSGLGTSRQRAEEVAAACALERIEAGHVIEPGGGDSEEKAKEGQ